MTIKEAISKRIIKLCRENNITIKLLYKIILTPSEQ